MDFDIRHYGAVGDGVANNAGAFQAAIDACHAAGGGRVVVAGRDAVYRAGTFELKSYVELHVEAGAKVLCSERLDECRMHERHDKRTACFIYAEGAEGVAITGMGTIDGHGRAYVQRGRYIHKPLGRRPHTLLLIGCRKVRISDVTFRDGADWSVRLTGCEDVVVHGVTILNDLAMPNSDGIDPDHCRNVRISDCHIETGDDCICIKARPEFPEFGPCENITVTGCTLISTSCALMVGIEAQAAIRNIVFDACVIRSSNRGLGIHLSHACDVENVIFSNMIIETRQFEERWWGSGEPVYVVAVPERQGAAIGKIRNVRFQNISCRSENGIVVVGDKSVNVSNIHFDHARIEMYKTSKWPPGVRDLRPLQGAPNDGRFPSASPAIYLENASDVAFHDVEVVWNPDLPDAYTHAMESVNVRNLDSTGLRGDAVRSGVCARKITPAS
jgi:polygalacturonase